MAAGRGLDRGDCGEEHRAPAADCRCGLHAWHPRRASARRILRSRFDLPGIVEADGAVEVHEEGFRAKRARPYAFVRLPGRNPFLIERLAAAYGAEVLDLRRAEELLAVCRERRLGLQEPVVEELIGAEAIAERRRARTRSGAATRCGSSLRCWSSRWSSRWRSSCPERPDGSRGRARLGPGGGRMDAEQAGGAAPAATSSSVRGSRRPPEPRTPWMSALLFGLDLILDGLDRLRTPDGQVAKSGVAPCGSTARPLGSSHSSWRPGR